MLQVEMTRCLQYTVIFLVLSGQAFAQRKHFMTEEGFVTDSVTYVTFSETGTNSWLFEGQKPATLSKSEIDQIDTILKKCVAVYNPNRQKEFDSLLLMRPGIKNNLKYFVIDLNRYKRQYIPITNEYGEKEIWVNCFCRNQNKNWLREYISVRDGGNCYFKVKINLTKRTYYELMVNDDV
jgi:hypothetical protein